MLKYKTRAWKMEKIVTAVHPESLPQAIGGYFKEQIAPMPHTCHKGYFDDSGDLAESSAVVTSELLFFPAAAHVCSWPVRQRALHRCFSLRNKLSFVW